MADQDQDPSQEPSARLRQQLGSIFGHLHRPGQPPPAAEPADGDEDETAANQEETLKRIREFNLKPREIRDHLDRFVIRQTEAKKVLAVAICDHYNHVRQCLADPDLREQDYAKPNIILLGPTGVGKTYLVRCLSKLIGVPFVKADATKFSETGYVGRDADDLVRDLVRLAGGNLELAQYGIIYLDEIDKIAGAANAWGGRDVSGRGVQVNLLKLMEDAEVSLHSQTDLIGQMEAIMEMMHGGGDRPRTISTRHILFIVSGAFDRLGEKVKRRMLGSRIGFTHAGETDEDAVDYVKYAQTSDFIDYGFEPEFIGRLPVRVACESLRPADLEEILSGAEGSILDQYRQDFAGYGITLEVAHEAIVEIARVAYTEKTGARGLMTVLERLFREFKYELPSTPIKALAVGLQTVQDPAGALAGLLHEHASAQDQLLRQEVQAFADRFHQDHGFRLDFTPEAVAALVTVSRDTHRTIRALCEDRFRDYQYGLSLVARGQTDFSYTITAEAVNDPDGTLSRWIVGHFPRPSVTAPADPPPEAPGGGAG